MNETLASESIYFEAKVNWLESSDSEESLPDDRAGLRPSEVVQQKFLSHVPNLPMPVSCLHTRRATRR